ncbi:MAG: hypothetical protein JXB17_09695, partial [Bacteroidales bacterium]|nr:hypothetical protein [Bacteroidales bacterium]
MKKRRLIILPALLIFILINACHSLKVNKEEKNEIIRLEKQDGPVQMVINFEKGKAFNHPSFVFWMEDLDGKYVETIYVTKSVATGLFRFGKPEKGEWVPSYKQYPAALPYWSHKKEAK